MVFLDGTATNVALPAIGSDLSVGFSGFQWIVNGYLLPLGALLLLGGSMADLYGRRRIFLIGTVGFAAASALCGFAQTASQLVLFRIIQGVAAALLVPASLAMLQGEFAQEERGRAIGAWSGFSGLSTIVGPLLGGWLVDSVSWRWIFFINPVLAAAVYWLTVRYVPRSAPGERQERSSRVEPGDEPSDRRSLDWVGALFAVLGLGGVIFALIEGPGRGWSAPIVWLTGAAGSFFLVAFLVYEAKHESPMLPLRFFRSRRFTGANAVTVFVYFVLSGMFFLLTLELQKVMGYSALEAGAAGTPVTLILLFLSPIAGRFSDRFGPRIPMTLGPLLAAAGVAMLSGVGEGSSYWGGILPALVVFGIGLGLTVAPLTATALSALDDAHAGIASGVNNAIARIAQLLGIPLLPLAAGLSGMEEIAGSEFTEGFARAMWIGAALLVVGAILAWTLLSGSREESAVKRGSDGQS
jgi:EmrB/QacA subfamily drug resistance transporter